jgi:hypothetical protein
MITINYNDLMMAVLSMDSYKYHEGEWKIGDAIKIRNAPELNGFAAVAYKYGTETIISYRGTDRLVSWNYGDVVDGAR